MISSKITTLIDTCIPMIIVRSVDYSKISFQIVEPLLQHIIRQLHANWHFYMFIV